MAETVKVVEQGKKPATPAPLQLVPAKDLMGRVEKLYEQIAKRAFQIFEGNGRNFGKELENWFKAESELLHPAPLNMTESDKEIEVRAEVPGFAANELDVSLEGMRLTIAGKRESKKETKEKKTVFQESRSDQILRVVDLPAAVDSGKVEATLKDGVLELRLPKAAPARKIEVEARAS